MIFDVEIQLYKDLSKAFCDAVKSISILIPSGYYTRPANEDECNRLEKKLYNEAIDAVKIAQDILKSNIPFLTDKMYEDYENILSLCRQQLGVFSTRWNIGIISSSKDILKHEDYERTKEINYYFKKINNDVRKYLYSLEVI